MLLVDNCAAHPHLDSLKNIKLDFLPPNTTSLVQPMDMGIIKNLKTLYRGKLVNYIIEKIEAKLVTSSSTSKEISAKINILQVVQFVADSWRVTSTKTILNCFGACGFKPLDSVMPPHAIDSENNEILQVPVINCSEYLSIDNNIECFDENEDCKTLNTC